MARRPLHLTAELVARVERRVEETAPEHPALTPLSDADFAAQAAALLALNPDAPFWVFVYGSLIWNPDFDHVETRPALVHGWRRSFCIGLRTWRGTPDEPGLMLALERGGSCRGLACRLPDSDPVARMERLLRREAAHAEALPTFRWLAARTPQGPVRALTFYAMPSGHPYLDPVGWDEKVRRLSRAAGRMGSCAAYLRNTVEHLEALGIRDSYLWRLQRDVAAAIAAAPPLAPAPSAAPAPAPDPAAAAAAG